MHEEIPEKAEEVVQVGTPRLGETDLAKMLASLTVSTRPERYTLVSLGADESNIPTIGGGIAGVLSEVEGFTVIVEVEVARRRGWPIDFEAAWLTLDVHSSLEAVGLTAAFSAALAEEEISCNVLAGYYHDHLLVPADRVEDARRCLEQLKSSSLSRGSD